jgi:Large polyvalent protein associated domain 29
MSEHNEMVEMARRVKSALRKAFPRTKFSVQTSGRIRVKWADHGPTVERVQDVVLTIGGVEVGHSWNDERRLRVSNGHGSSFYFDRYSVAERIAQEHCRHRAVRSQ